MKAKIQEAVPVQKAFSMAEAIARKGIYRCTEPAFADTLFIIADEHITHDMPPAVFTVKLSGNKGASKTNTFNGHSWSDKKAFVVFEGSVTLQN